MTGFSLPDNYIADPKAILRKSRSHTASSFATPPPAKPVNPTPSTTTVMAQKTLHEFFVPVVANVPTGPAINVGDKNFELRTGLITMVQASPFYGLPSEDANAHLQHFLELCNTIVIKDAAPDIIRLRLFPFFLVGKAKQWFYHTKKLSTRGQSAPRRSSPNSFPWAKPLP
jgi:hypothetical protein